MNRIKSKKLIFAVVVFGALIVCLVLTIFVINNVSQKHIFIRSAKGSLEVVLPYGWDIESVQGIDTLVGYLTKDGKRLLGYELGMLAQRSLEYEDESNQIVVNDTSPNGHKRRIAYSKSGYGVVSVYIETNDEDLTKTAAYVSGASTVENLDTLLRVLETVDIER